MVTQHHPEALNYHIARRFRFRSSSQSQLRYVFIDTFRPQHNITQVPAVALHTGVA